MKKLSMILIFIHLSCSVPKARIEVTSTTPKTSDNISIPPPKTVSVSLDRGDTLISALTKNSVDRVDALELASHISHFVDLRKLQPNTTFQLSWESQNPQILKSLVLEQTKTQYLRFEKSPTSNSWISQRIDRTPDVVINTYSGEVSSSFWDSAESKGVDPTLILEISEIFSWVIDFNREVRKGDKWRFVVKEKYLDKELVGRNPIEVIEYKSKSESYKAVFYKAGDGKGGYYFPDGKSLQTVFLKSPIKFGRVTSRFNRRRYHPILKKKIAHNGVDYGAAIGTPVRSVGDGRITFAGRNGASGIMARVKHNSVYTTSYLHLKSLAKGIKRGRRIDQGTILGFVGTTGRTTGPHLHFSFYENGRFVDPLGRKFPSKDPIPPPQMKEFLNLSNLSLNKLPQWGDEFEEKISWHLAKEKEEEKEPIF